MRNARATIALLGVLGASTQDVAGPPSFAWRPRLPLEGSAVVLELSTGSDDSVTAVQGELAGGPLHFERTTEGFRALGAVPLNEAGGDGVEAPGGGEGGRGAGGSGGVRVRP